MRSTTELLQSQSEDENRHHFKLQTLTTKEYPQRQGLILIFQACGLINYSPSSYVNSLLQTQHRTAYINTTQNTHKSNNNSRDYITMSIHERIIRFPRAGIKCKLGKALPTVFSIWENLIELDWGEDLEQSLNRKARLKQKAEVIGSSA